MTPAQEIETLKRLSQRGCAYLLGVTPRALRYNQQVPRSSDGTYNGPAVVTWLVDRARAASRPAGLPVVSPEESAALEISILEAQYGRR